MLFCMRAIQKGLYWQTCINDRGIGGGQRPLESFICCFEGRRSDEDRYVGCAHNHKEDLCNFRSRIKQKFAQKFNSDKFILCLYIQQMNT